MEDYLRVSEQDRSVGAEIEQVMEDASLDAAVPAPAAVLDLHAALARHDLHLLFLFQ
jgi:hypothetical protein